MWGRSAVCFSAEMRPPPAPISWLRKRNSKNKVLENIAAKNASLSCRSWPFGGKVLAPPVPVRIDQRQRQPDRCCAVEREISDRKLASSEHHLGATARPRHCATCMPLPLLVENASCRPCVARRPIASQPGHDGCARLSPS